MNKYMVSCPTWSKSLGRTLLSSFCLNFGTSHLALNEDYFKRFVLHFPIGHKSNPVNLGRSELWTLKELMSPLALVTYFTTKPYWILALKYTKSNELTNGTKTSHSWLNCVWNKSLCQRNVKLYSYDLQGVPSIWQQHWFLTRKCMKLEKKVALSGLKMKRLYWTYLWMFGISFIIKGKKALLKSQWTMKHLNFLNINYFSNTCSFDSLRSLTQLLFTFHF